MFLHPPPPDLNQNRGTKCFNKIVPASCKKVEFYNKRIICTRVKDGKETGTDDFRKKI